MVSSAVKGFALYWTVLGLYCHWKRSSLRRRGREKVYITNLSSSKLTFYSTRHRDLHQVRWSDVTDLWHWSRRRCQSQKCGGRSRKKVQKTIVRVYLSATRRCLLRRQVLVNLVPKCRPDSSVLNLMQICILPKQVNIRTRWKFSLRRRHPHLMIPLSRCCLFQCSKIILNSACIMQ